VSEALDAPTRVSGAVLAATKLHIPEVRAELLTRAELVDSLVGRATRKLTLIEAPAGYGKTTLLAEWSSSPSEPRDFAWLSLDEGDSDPARFWTGVIDALRGVEPGLAASAREALGARNIDLIEVALPLLLNELVKIERGIVLVLDDYQVVRDDEVHGSVAFMLENLPEHLHLAIATRSDPPLPLARLRAGGEMLEIRAHDLRFSDREAAELLRRTVGLDLDDVAVTRLSERTEGWPAGLYLAGLSLRGREDVPEFIELFAGDDRHILDYLSSEVLGDQPDGLKDFLLRTSVLERLSGPLCDAVAETEDSDRLLESIERENLFVMPLDTTRTWYRYHRLFAELLRHELRATDPTAIRVLHRRAGEWYRAEGSVPDAIHHTAQAGDIEDARELIALHWNDYFNQGRLGTVERWLAAIPRGSVVEDPRLCVAGAWLGLDRGELDQAREWIEAASVAAQGWTIPTDDRSIDAEIGVSRAVHRFKVGELEAAGAAATEVIGLAEKDTFPYTVAQLILGVTLYWRSEPDGAAAALQEGERSARETDNDLGRSYALGYLALIEADRDQVDDGDRLATKATALSDAPGFAEHFVLSIGHLALARASELRGRLDDAERSSRRAVELARRGAGRVELAASGLALARVRHLQDDRAEARELLRDARSLVEDCDDAEKLAAELAAAERGLAMVARGAALGEPSAREGLSDREVVVLRMLAGSLSRREIADALYVSQNTIKTQVRSIYQKLDASDREAAVANARERGLL
jgi:LuxR family maltose regulon positive regulatory protein